MKLLALAPAHRLPRDWALDLLWPELPPEAASNNLYQAVHCLRRALTSPAGAAQVHLQRGVLILHPMGPIQVDVAAFEAAVAQARGSDDPALYAAALALYTGELLPDDLYEDWAAPHREALNGLFQSLSLEAAELHAQHGMLNEGIEILERLLILDPVNEDAYAGLMRLYAQVGRRQQALRQYARLEEVLRRELDVEPDIATRRLYAEIMANVQDIPSPRPVTSTGNLPSFPDRFVGREQEVHEVQSLLAGTRLLTLTGVGGSGKTRLACEVAGKAGSCFAGGMWLVELAGVTDGCAVPKAIADALGLDEEPGVAPLRAVTRFVGTRHTLLLIDNCEHLIEAGAEAIDQLLKRCPHLTVLVTSREALHVPGELVWRVPGMSITDATALFHERARLRLPSFVPGVQDDLAVAEICRRLEGIPLAIELAAARIAVLTPVEIAQRLGDALRLLSSGSRTALPRQRTLRATLDWSYALLTGEEQALLRHLAVFRGGWYLEDAEAIDPEEDVLLLLAQLVDRSLVQVKEGRYRLLEVVRQYAHEHLVAPGEVDNIQRMHAAYFQQLAEKGDAALMGANQISWLARLEQSHENLRTALLWYKTYDPAGGLWMAANLWRFWYAHKHLAEGREWLRYFLATVPDAPALWRAKALRGAASLAYGQRDHHAAMKLAEMAISLYDQAGDTLHAARIQRFQGLLMAELGEYGRAQEVLESSLAVFRTLGEIDDVGTALGNLGVLAYRQGDWTRAQHLMEEDLAIHRQAQDSTSVAIALNNLAEIAERQHDGTRAKSLYAEALQLGSELGEWEIVQSGLDGLARQLARDGRPEMAVELHATAAKVRDVNDVALAQPEMDVLTVALQDLRTRLGEERFVQAWSAGMATGHEDAVTRALYSMQQQSECDPLPIPALSSAAPIEPESAKDSLRSNP